MPTSQVTPCVYAALVDVLPSSRVGSYVRGVLLSTVPFQQYSLKQLLHTAGMDVLVRYIDRCRMAHPTQLGQDLSTVAFPRVDYRMIVGL